MLFNDLTELAKVEVTEILLQEVPDQFVDFMVINAVEPNQFMDEPNEECEKERRQTTSILNYLET